MSSNESADITRAILAAQASAKQAATSAQSAQRTAAQTQQLYNIMIQFTTTWKGAWNSGTFYRAYDSVSYSGSSYIATMNGSNNQPDISPLFWDVVAAGGSGGGGSVHTGDGLQGDGSSGTPVIVSDAGITNAKLATMVSHTFKGNATGGTASPTDLTAVQVANLLPLATGSQQGVVSGADSDKISTLTPEFSHYNVRFVHPLGNNANPGTTNAPMKTRAAAYISLISAGGGDIYVAADCVTSDGTEVYTDHNGTHTLTAGQGWWVTGWSQGPTRPGFMPYKPVNWHGWGADDTANFGGLGVRWDHGDASPDRTNSAVWFGPDCFAPSTFEGINFYGNVLTRQGWDYRRNSDASLAWGNITGAVRTAGVDTQHTNSVFTVDFPEAWDIISFGRASGVVTVEVNMPLQPTWPPIYKDMWVRINSTTSGFASIDVQTLTSGVQNLSNPPGAQHITFTYTQAGSDIAFGPVAAGGTVQSHCFKASDILEGEFTNDQWPTTIYEVVDTTIDTVTVRDPYGYDASGWGGIARTASASGSNVGSYVLQDRQLTLATDLNKYVQCSWSIGAGNTLECFNIGPLADFGSCFLPSTVDGGGCSGLPFCVLGGNPGTADYFRSAAIFVYGGSAGVAGVITSRTNFVNGNILVQPSQFQPWEVQCGYHLQDWGPNNLGTNYLRPLVEFIDKPGQAQGTGRIMFCMNADSAVDTDFPAVYLASQGGGFVVEGVDFVEQNPNAAYTSTDANDQPIIINDLRPWYLETRSPEQMGRTGWATAENRLLGKRSDAQTQFGVVEGQGLVNCFNEDLTTWTPNNTDTIAAAAGYSTAGIDGGNNAFRITGTGQLNAGFAHAVTPVAVGDHFVFGAFVRGVNGGPLPAQILFSYYTNNISEGARQVVGYFTASAGDGDWQWVTAIGYADQISDLYFCAIYSDGNDYDIAYPTLLRLAAADYSANEAFRIVNTFRPFPAYLQAGQAGTMTDQPLIGHGGLGSAKHYVQGTDPGQAEIGSPNGNLFELFDESGASQGVVALSSYTYHPYLSISPTAVNLLGGATQLFTAAGGVSPYTLTISVNHSGGSIVDHGDGTATYTAGTNSGNNADTILVTDSAAATKTATAHVHPVLAISPTTPTVASGAKQTFTSTGGSGGNVFSIVTNNSGATIDPATGVYQAGFVSSGVTDTVRVTDSASETADATITVTAATGIKLWLNARAGVTQSGGFVSAWADQSGNGNDVTQSNGSFQPVFDASSVNGQPGITFNGTGDYFENAVNSVASATDRTVVAVTKYASAANSAGTVMSFQKTTPNLGIYLGLTGIPYVAGDGVGTNAVTVNNVTDTPGVYEWYEASSVITDFYSNGVDSVVSAGVLTPEAGTTGTYIGRAVSGAYYNGDLLELFVFDHVLDSTEKTNLRQYLQTTYGINLGV